MKHAKEQDDVEISRALEEDATYGTTHRVIVSNIAAGADGYDVAEMFEKEWIAV